MNISILGTGNLATCLAVLFAKAGHTITLGQGTGDAQRRLSSVGPRQARPGFSTTYAMPSRR